MMVLKMSAGLFLTRKRLPGPTNSECKQEYRLLVPPFLPTLSSLVVVPAPKDGRRSWCPSRSVNPTDALFLGHLAAD